MLTTKQMVRIDRAIGGKMMDATTMAFMREHEDALDEPAREAVTQIAESCRPR